MTNIHNSAVRTVRRATPQLDLKKETNMFVSSTSRLSAAIASPLPNIGSTSEALKAVTGRMALTELQKQVSVTDAFQSLLRSSSREFLSSARLHQTLVELEQPEALKQIRQFKSLSVFRALYALKNAPLSGFADIIESLGEDDLGVEDTSLLQVEESLKNEIQGAVDYKDLSAKTRAVLTYLCHNAFWVFVGLLVSEYRDANVVEAKKEAAHIGGSREAKSFARVGSPKFDISALEGHRIITGNNVNLREDHGLKSHVITMLPVGTLVEVLDSDNKAWLLVKVEVEGELLQGWISRRYTKPFQ